MAEHWDIFQKEIIKDNEYTFLKTHNASININNHDFANLNNTIGLIYIIRDPRDVVVSYSSHLNLDVEETFEIMKREDSLEKTNENFDRSLLTSWKNHYNSWKYFPKNKIFIKYEDLIDKPNETFLELIKFLNKIIKLKVDEKLIKDSLNKVSFETLQSLEAKDGFPENRSIVEKNKFFKVGKKGQWNKKLKNDLVSKINKCFEIEMKELNYL